MRSTWHLFTWPHSDQQISNQSPGQPISNQSSVQATPYPNRLHKLCDSPCSFHSDSDQQKDNINCIQPPHSTICFIRMLPTRHCQPHIVLCMLSPMASKVSLYIIFLLCILSHIYCAAYTCNKFSTCSFRWPHSTSTRYS